MTDFIKTFWDSQAETHGQSHSASWGDNFAISLEIENISKYIKDGDIVLDVGCANGFATLIQAEKHDIEISGIDFSEQMIAQGLHNKEISDRKIKLSIGDVRQLPYIDNSFDVTYTTRCLINLPNWEDQIQGIFECIRVTKKGGTIVFSEAFYEPLVLLNSLRQLKQLTPLVEHDFNRYLKKEKLQNMLEHLLDEKLIDGFKNIDFSSVYYLGSRFLRELVTNPNDYKGYSNPINNHFYELEKEFSGGGFGIQQAYIIKK